MSERSARALARKHWKLLSAALLLVAVAFGAGLYAPGADAPADDAAAPRARKGAREKAPKRRDRKADRRRDPAAEEPAAVPGETEVLVRGTITIDPDLAAHAPPGGAMHLRVVCLELRRPCMFQKLENVAFPFTYAFTARNAVSETGLRAVRTGDFYVELFYAPPGEPLYGNRELQIGGEAWAPPGKPVPLRAGATADVVIGGFWTPSLYKGTLTHLPTAYLEGWIYPTPQLKAKITPKNRLTFLMVTDRKAPGAAEATPVVLAAKVYANIDPERPVGYHLGAEDFLVHPIDEEWNVYYRTRLECFEPDGRLAYYLDGGRASPQVMVGIRDAGFKIVLHRLRDVDSFANLHFDVARVPVSETTYE